MSHKLHMLHSHLDEFKDNMGVHSEEQGERFHQDVMDFERRYQGQYNESAVFESCETARYVRSTSEHDFQTLKAELLGLPQREDVAVTASETMKPS
ncbi:hypothetical protein ILUMI_16520 [Ignelater luminosus]|uniref:Uncharacterized protein n=1 Tax=Ignelater luminosus TaxID=2038154 RepID=A0A8K0CS61_IGNLU|nr:hypothetical protein ILUMI_16520 [Ignelater luminosus]